MTLMLKAGLNQVLLDQGGVVERVVTAVLARGHVLLEGLPGLGKTELCKGLARLLQLPFKRLRPGGMEPLPINPPPSTNPPPFTPAQPGEVLPPSPTPPLQPTLPGQIPPRQLDPLPPSVPLPSPAPPSAAPVRIK